MAERYLSFGLIVGVVVWLGVIAVTPGPQETAAKEQQAVDCAVICMDTQPITWQAAPPAPIPAATLRDWPDQRPI